jgi:hypothetical protein
MKAAGVVPNLRNVVTNYLKWFLFLRLPKLPAIYGLDSAGAGSDEPLFDERRCRLHAVARVRPQAPRVAVVRVGNPQRGDHVCEQPLGATAHVHRRRAQPQRVDTDRRERICASSPSYIAKPGG